MRQPRFMFIRPLGSLREGAGSAARRRLKEFASLTMIERSDELHILSVGRRHLTPPLRTECLLCIIEICTGGVRSRRPTATSSFYPNALFLRVRHSPSPKGTRRLRRRRSRLRRQLPPRGSRGAVRFGVSSPGCGTGRRRRRLFQEGRRGGPPLRSGRPG